MGEAVVSSEGRMQFEVQETVVETEMGVQNTAEGGGAAAATAENSAAVQWERFLPKMVVRVLLVEADDSTRQIISALLRKCSYRVAAVSDGLKAWEVLKGRPHSIDLILTEVELPSISGYALLTLIMEHEACKNIPVIMMSSQDSVSTVYKCMLRGATDFLVKPIRKNELRNLWQHVWRKQASSTGAGLGPPDQEKDEATAENNAISNHSSGYMSCIQRNREGIEKGSDAQSSCSKPESETEGEGNDHVLPESTRCLSDGTNISSQEEFHPQNKKRLAFDSETKELQVVADVDAGSAMTRENKNSDDMQEQVKASVENNQFLENSSREAIDLIGAFDTYLKSTFGASFANVNASKLDILPPLDLSLRRSHPSVSVNHVNDEKQMLNHSDSSPFSRYVNKPLQLSMSTSPSTYNQHMDYEPYSEKKPSKTTNHNSDTHGPVLSSPKHVSMATFPTGRPEFPFSCSQNRDISHPIPVRGVRFEGFINGYNPVMPSPYSAQSGSSSLPSPGKAHHTESFPQTAPFYPSESQPSSSQQLHGFGDQRISNSMDQIVNKQGNKVEDLEDGGLISPGNDQSANSNFCNGNSKINGVSVMNAPSECGSGNEEGFLIHDGASHRSMQREAALTKFRLKRKDRCFEKKVRYESRKKLAEQRPRIKGQFVRQVPNEDQPGNSSAC